MNAEGEWNGQKRQTTDLLAYLKDEGKWTWDQIGAALDKIASFYENGDLETDMPNSRRIKRIELVLDDMLSNGYTTMDGIEIAPDRGWLEYKKELPGAEAQAIPENAVYGAYEVRYSARANIEFIEDKYYERLIDDFENQKKGSYIKVGRVMPGSVLAKVGLPSAELFFDNAKIVRVLSEHGDHISKEILKKLPDILRRPVVISEDARPGNINVFGDVWIGNSPVLVGIVVNYDRSGRNVINKVRTVHARRNAADKITDSSVLYLGEDKKRTRNWFQALGTHLPLGGTKYRYIRSIPQPASDFNPEIKNSTRGKY